MLKFCKSTGAAEIVGETMDIYSLNAETRRHLIFMYNLCSFEN